MNDKRIITELNEQARLSWGWVYGDINARAADVDDEAWGQRPDECWDAIAEHFTSRMVGHRWGEPTGQGWSKDDVADFTLALMYLVEAETAASEKEARDRWFDVSDATMVDLWRDDQH